MNEMISLTYACPICRKLVTVIVPEDGYYRWVKGEFIHHAMSDTPADVREFLITHICPACQKKLYEVNKDDKSIRN